MLQRSCTPPTIPNLEAIGSNTIFYECWSRHWPKLVEMFVFRWQWVKLIYGKQFDIAGTFNMAVGYIWNRYSSISRHIRQIFLQALVYLGHGNINCCRSCHVSQRWKSKEEQGKRRKRRRWNHTFGEERRIFCGKRTGQNRLRASFCKYRKSGDIFNIFSFFIFCPNKAFSELFSKIQLKDPKALEFFQNRGKFENRHFGLPPPLKIDKNDTFSFRSCW